MIGMRQKSREFNERINDHLYEMGLAKRSTIDTLFNGSKGQFTEWKEYKTKNGNVRYSRIWDYKWMNVVVTKNKYLYITWGDKQIDNINIFSEAFTFDKLTRVHKVFMKRLLNDNIQYK